MAAVLAGPVKFRVEAFVNRRFRVAALKCDVKTMAPRAAEVVFGIGLLAAAAADLHGRGFSTLSLTVTQANGSAVALYERLGFKIERGIAAEFAQATKGAGKYSPLGGRQAVEQPAQDVPGRLRHGIEIA